MRVCRRRAVLLLCCGKGASGLLLEVLRRLRGVGSDCPPDVSAAPPGSGPLVWSQEEPVAQPAAADSRSMLGCVRGRMHESVRKRTGRCVYAGGRVQPRTGGWVGAQVGKRACVPYVTYVI